MTESSSPVSQARPGASADPVKRAQHLRLQRMFWACAPLSALISCVMIYVWLGWVPVGRAMEYAALIAGAWVLFFGLVLSGANLRLPDPSLTVAQILTGIFCQLYIMFFLTEPLLRVPFLLLGTVNMMFAVFAMNLWRMLLLNVIGVSAYAAMILLKVSIYPVGLAPWQAELLVVLAFFLAIAMNAYIGSVIVGLRDKLRGRNSELQAAMLQLEDLATRDSLTRLPNRRSVMQRMQQEQSRLERSTGTQATLCLCMLDVDHFKQINDQYGHMAGDAVLQWLGALFAQHLRAQDFIGRLGGEEFLLLLPGTDMQAAKTLANRLLAAVREATPPALPGQAQVTLSGGVAEYEPGQRLAEMLKLADQCLYRAKANGRDQIALPRGP